MAMKLGTNTRHRPLKIRKVLHYLSLMLLVMAISLPVALLPQAAPVEASFNPYIWAPFLESPAHGTITNSSVVYLSSDGASVTGGYDNYNDTLYLCYWFQADNNPDFSSPEVDHTGYYCGSGYTTQSLADGKYYWRSRASGEVHRDWNDEVFRYSDWSETWSFTIDTIPPAVPVLASPAKGEIIIDTTPTLQWNAASDATSITYEWQVTHDAGFSSIYLSSTTTAISYTFISPLPCDSYYWRVRAKDAAGNIGGWSDSWYFLMLSPPKLISPANTSYVDTLNPTLSWSNDGMQYQVQVDNQSDFSSPNTNAYWITGNICNTTVSLREGITYYWRGRSHTGSYTSVWSPVWTFTTDTIPPAMPTLVSPANGSTTYDTNPTLDWNAASGASNYEWQLSNVAAFPPTPYASGITSGTAYTFPSSLPYGRYFWRVRAKDSAGNDSNWSAIWSFTTTQGNATLTVTPVSGPYGGIVSLSARLTKTVDGAPIVGKIITFSLRGASVGGAITNANGVATLLAIVSLFGNPVGVYPTGIKASFAGDAIYNPISGIAQLSIKEAAPPPSPSGGQGATGASWYTLEDRGRVDFSFNVNQIPDTDPLKYKGEVLLINDGRWRLKGTLDYYRYSNSQGIAFGSGQLTYWDSALNKGQGGWVVLVDDMANNTIDFSINFADAYTGKAKDSLAIDKFGINISIGVPEGAPPLPNSSPAVLEGGNIDIKDIIHSDK
jgi:hypothetical protein